MLIRRTWLGKTIRFRVRRVNTGMYVLEYSYFGFLWTAVMQHLEGFDMYFPEMYSNDTDALNRVAELEKEHDVEKTSSEVSVKTRFGIPARYKIGLVKYTHNENKSWVIYFTYLGLHWTTLKEKAATLDVMVPKVFDNREEAEEELLALRGR